jgi:NADH-quinone oxidoreductase subunit G
VLLGADPLADFPDRALAERALAGARTVVALDRFVTGSIRAAADVVMAVAGHGEMDGTHTNVEGRVTALHRKVTPPGTTRTDWMIAAEIAERLGGDIGVLTSETELWEELVTTSAAHAGLDAAVLADPENHDGLLLDLDRSTFGDVEPTPAPSANAYSLRLVVNRALYDQGAMLSRAEHARSRAARATLHLSPADLAQLGVSSGDIVTVSSSSGSLSTSAVADEAVPRGSALMRHNPVSADPGVLVSVGDVVSNIRVEVG